MSNEDPRLVGLDTPLRPPERRTTSVVPPPPPSVPPAQDAPEQAAPARSAPRPQPTAREARPAPRATPKQSAAGGRVAASLPPELDSTFRKVARDHETTQGEVLLAALRAHGADVVANPPRTGFLKAAEARQCVTLDGLGMLVNQALIAVRLWTGEDVSGDGVPDIVVGDKDSDLGRTDAGSVWLVNGTSETARYSSLKSVAFGSLNERANPVRLNGKAYRGKDRQGRAGAAQGPGAGRRAGGPRASSGTRTHPRAA